MIAFRPDEVQAKITQRIVALDAKPAYSGDNGAWRESLNPLVPEWAPGTSAHLTFFVDDRETELYPGLRQNARTQQAPYVSSPIVVRFLFQLPALNKNEAWKNAAIAACDLTAWLLDTTWTEDFNLVLSDRLISRVPLASQEWVHVECRYRVSYYLSLAELPLT